MLAEIKEKFQSFIDDWTKGYQLLVDSYYPSDDDNADKTLTMGETYFAHCMFLATREYFSTTYQFGFGCYFSTDVFLNNGNLTTSTPEFMGTDSSSYWGDLFDIDEMINDVKSAPLTFTVDNGDVYAFIGSQFTRFKAYYDGVYHDDYVHINYGNPDIQQDITDRFSVWNNKVVYSTSEVSGHTVINPSSPDSTQLIPIGSNFKGLAAIKDYPIIGNIKDITDINDFVNSQGATHNYTTTYTTPNNKTIRVYYGDNYIITHVDDNEPVSYNDIKNALNIAVNKINDDNGTNIKVPTYDDNKYGDNVDKNHTKPMDLNKFVPDTNGMVYYYELDKDNVWKVRSGLNTINLDATVLKDVTRNLISYKLFAFSPTALIKTKTPVIVHIGGREIKYEGNSIPANYVEELNTIALGAINISKLFGDYRDYAPYTKIELFVPFCGWTTLPSWCIDTTITGELFVDMWNGSCKAVIKASALDAPDGVVVCEMGGVCAYDVPFVADATGAKAASLLSKVATTAGAVATGNPLAIATSGISLATALNENYTRMIGVVGDGSNINGLDHMFVKLTRVSWTDAHKKERPDAYKHMHGIPCGKQLTLTAGDGYTQILDATITGAMTDREKQMIIDGFRHGLIL